MAWKQKLTPNLDDNPNNPLYIWQGGQILTDWYGWCLAVVAGSYGAQGSSYSAKTAWESCPTRHMDRNIPEGIYVPLWYGGGTYGHVVIGLRSGSNLTIWSSPYTHIATFQKFSGNLDWALDYVGQVYGVGSFSGWSETVLDSRVIEQYTETKPEPTPTPTPVSSCTKISVVRGDTMGAIMKRCKGSVEWGAAMNEYASKWYSTLVKPGQSVYQGWISGSGVGLYAGDVIEFRD